MSNWNIHLKDSIATYLLRVVFGLYFVVAVLVTVIQLTSEYYHVKEAILQDLQKNSLNFWSRNFRCALDVQL